MFPFIVTAQNKGDICCNPYIKIDFKRTDFTEWTSLSVALIWIRVISKCVFKFLITVSQALQKRNPRLVGNSLFMTRLIFGGRH